MDEIKPPNTDFFKCTENGINTDRIPLLDQIMEFSAACPTADMRKAAMEMGLKVLELYTYPVFFVP